MMKKMYLFLLAFCLTGWAGAQNSFLLYSFKGNVSVVENKAETKAKVGKMLKTDATVKIAPGGSATLICNESAMFTLGKPGTYALSQFGDSCKQGSGSVSANYVKYVWAQMTKPSGPAGSNRKEYMNTVGAVSRSINNVWIDPKLDTVNYAGGDFPLSWKSYANAKEFTFYLYSSDNLNVPIYKTNVSKLKIPIKSFADKMKPGKSYLWTACIKGEENDELKVLNFVGKPAYAELEASLKEQGAGFESPAEQAYRLAFMLEDAHYLSEAHQYYGKAVSLAPANVIYRSTLMSFRKDYEIK